MPRPASKYPTELELEILKILWRDGPANVRIVREALAQTRKLAYTSVMTTMTIMVEKGYLKRTKKGGSYTYQPRVTEQDTGRRMLGDLVDRVFDGSAQAAMLHLLEASEIDEAELHRIRELINSKVKERSK